MTTNEELMALIQEGDFKKFEKLLQKEDWNTLSQRQESFRKFRSEELKKPQPLETDKQRMQRNAQLMEAQRILTQQVEKKKEEAKQEYLKAKYEWQKREVLKNLHLLRYLYGASATMLKNGLVTPDAFGNEWKTPTNTVIPITTNDGRKTNFDLIKDIHPDNMKTILERAYSLHIFQIRSPVAYKKGKPMGIWRKPEDFSEESKIKPVFNPTYIAIRKV